MQAFGDHLRRWRREKSLSQLALAALAETSTRHLSFLESGRSSPGRGMVLRLATALEVTPAERDRALEVAGFPPLCRRPAPAAEDAEAMRQAIATLVRGHGALPAFVLDADWCLLASNDGGRRLLATLGVALPDDASLKRAHGDPESPSSPGLIDLLVALAGGEVMLNWDEVAGHVLERARAELARRDEARPPLADAVRRLEAVREARCSDAVDASEVRPAAPGVTNGPGADPEIVTTPVVVPLRVLAGETTLSLITMVARFGGIDYVDVDAPGVELMFAADEVTRRWFETEHASPAAD